MYWLVEGELLADRAAASSEWPHVQGTIESSRVTEHTQRTERINGTGTTTKTHYTADVHYRYTVGEEELSGATVRFGSAGQFENGDTDFIERFEQRDEARAVVDRYPPGTAVPVHYDPARPELSVLEPGGSSLNWEHVAALIFLGVGLAGPVLLGVPALRKARRKRRKRLRKQRKKARAK